MRRYMLHGSGSGRPAGIARAVERSQPVILTDRPCNQIIIVHNLSAPEKGIIGVVCAGYGGRCIGDKPTIYPLRLRQTDIWRSRLLFHGCLDCQKPPVNAIRR